MNFTTYFLANIKKFLEIVRLFYQNIFKITQMWSSCIIYLTLLQKRNLSNYVNSFQLFSHMLNDLWQKLFFYIINFWIWIRILSQYHYIWIWMCLVNNVFMYRYITFITFALASSLSMFIYFCTACMFIFCFHGYINCT